MKINILKIFAVMIIPTLFIVTACTSKMTKEKYISVMTELGCKHLAENSKSAEDILKEKKVTSQDLEAFRKNMKAEESLEVAGKIAKGVLKCHGVKLPEEKK